MNTHVEIERMREAVTTGNLMLFEHMVERLRYAAQWQAKLREIRAQRAP